MRKKVFSVIVLLGLVLSWAVHSHATTTYETMMISEFRADDYLPSMNDYGTLYVTYPVFSSNIDELYGVILPIFFISVKS